jgi:hypothetical protein
MGQVGQNAGQIDDAIDAEEDRVLPRRGLRDAEAKVAVLP